MWLAQLKQPMPTLTRNYRKAPGAAAAAKCVAAAERFAAVAVEVAALAEVEAVAELAAIADRSASADDDGDDGDDGDQDSTGRPRAGRRNLIGVEHDGDAGMVQPPPRFLTPRECARVQGFPEYFKLPQNGAPNGPSATLFGNVVSPPIVDDEDARLCEASKAEVDTARSGVAEGDVLCAAMELLEQAVPVESRTALRTIIGSATAT
jgi:site-specific DNA-cytosine methylase